nr:prolyl oligopeptidase family serine peptidase [Mesorhizobium loti]
MKGHAMNNDDTLSLDILYAEPSIIGTTPEGAVWSADSKRLAFLWNDAGKRFRDIWVHDIKAAAKHRLTWLGDERAAGPGITRAAWLGDGRVVFILDKRLHIAGPDGNVSPVEPDRLEIGALAVHGNRLAFTSNGSLLVKDFGAGQPARVLVAGAEQLAVESFEWSGDGALLAFVQADNRTVRQIEIAYDFEGSARRDTHTRAFPGDEIVRLRPGVVPAAGGEPIFFTRPDEQDAIWGFGLSSDGRSLFVNSSDLSIKNHTIFVYDVATGACTTYYHFHDPIQIRPDWKVAWAPKDHGLILLTNRDGYNHLYRLPGAGAAPEQITDGDWEIESFQLDADRATIHFTANLPHNADRSLHKVPVAGGKLKAVTTGHGTHQPVYSPDFAWVADRFSDDLSPPELYLRSLDSAGAETRLTHSPLPAFRQKRWAEVRYVDCRSSNDGALLDVRLMLPPDHDPSRRYPLVVGSVYSDTLCNQWGGRDAHPSWGLDQYLVSRGFIVASPGIRGSFGRGKEWNRPMLHSYGQQDIEDIADCVTGLVEQGYADPARVGIWGSSYGGLMTLMSLFKKPGFYAAGVAGAPATNVWHAYPEQEWIMGAPRGEDYPARYEHQSALYHSRGLADPLMIIHGTSDEVVLYSDTIALVEKFIEQGKRFELVTLPGSGHSWARVSIKQTRFAYGKLAEFFEAVLKPE